MFRWNMDVAVIPAVRVNVVAPTAALTVVMVLKTAAGET
jgi:hypothetical protein